jgi:hypothetical protein
MFHGFFLMVEPSSYWVRTLTGHNILSVLEGALVMALAVGILLKSRASAILLFLYVLAAKVILVIAFRRYYALLPGLFWLINYYCGILGTFSPRK